MFFCRQSVHHYFMFYICKFPPLLFEISIFLCCFVWTPPPVIFSTSSSNQTPLPPPPSISTSVKRKKKQSIITPPLFCCRLRPIRANHSTVGVVARRLLCVWFVAAWVRRAGGRGQPSVCPSAGLPPPPAPWLCLAVLALKGRRHTIGFTQTHQSLD